MGRTLCVSGLYIRCLPAVLVAILPRQLSLPNYGTITNSRYQLAVPVCAFKEIHVRLNGEQALLAEARMPKMCGPGDRLTVSDRSKNREPRRADYPDRESMNQTSVPLAEAILLLLRYLV